MSLLIILLFCLNGSITFSQCIEVNYQKAVLGEDFFNVALNPEIKICEDDGIIEFGSGLFYIQDFWINDSNEFVYKIQEVKGLGWPTVGFVKLSKEDESIQIKYFDNTSTYQVLFNHE
jgi:hypothetical protein